MEHERSWEEGNERAGVFASHGTKAMVFVIYLIGCLKCVLLTFIKFQVNLNIHPPQLSFSPQHQPVPPELRLVNPRD